MTMSSCCQHRLNSSQPGKTGCPLGKLSNKLHMLNAYKAFFDLLLCHNSTVLQDRLACLFHRSNTSAVQLQQLDQQSGSCHIPDSLLAQLGHLPSKLRSSAETVPAQQLRTSGCFSLQFLEPPNSQHPSGQLMHPALATQPSTGRMSFGAGGDKNAALASIPGHSSLLRPGAPVLNTLGVSSDAKGMILMHGIACMCRSLHGSDDSCC